MSAAAFVSEAEMSPLPKMTAFVQALRKVCHTWIEFETLGTSTSFSAWTAKSLYAGFLAKNAGYTVVRLARNGIWPVFTSSALSSAGLVENLRKSHAVAWFLHDVYMAMFLASEKE